MAASRVYSGEECGHSRGGGLVGLIRRGGSRPHDDPARVHDPGAAFHVGHVRQLRALQQLRTSSAQLAASGRRLEVQALDLRTRRSRLEDQARRALVAGREAEAIDCLTQSQGIRPQIDDLESRVRQLGELRSRLDASGRRLEASAVSSRSAADALQTQSLQAQYGTAVPPAGGAARVGGSEDPEGRAEVDPEDGDVDRLVQQARDKTLWAQARAEAGTELIDRDDEPVADPPGAAIDPAVSRQVLSRLAELRAELDAQLTAAGAEARSAADAGICEGVQVLERQREAPGPPQ